jgi:hypothetical protein
VTIDGVWIRYWIYWPLTPLRTTHNYSSTANLHTLQFTTAPAKPFPACCILTGCSLETASNSGDFSASLAQVLLSQPPMRNSCQFLQSQLPTISLPSLLSSLQNSTQLPTLNYPLSIILAAGLGSSLYSLGVDPTENTAFKSSSIVVGVFIDPLPRNGRCTFAYCIATAIHATIYSYYVTHQLTEGIILY